MNQRIILFLFVGIVGIFLFSLYKRFPLLNTSYFLTESKSILTERLIPTPTPTPFYFSYINQPADYVGVIETIESPEQISLARDDGSKVILNLKPNVPIYQIQWQDEQLAIQTQTTKILEIGDELSIHTEDKNVLAIFVLHNNEK